MYLTRTAYDKHYYLQHQASGLDYATYGDWQIDYGRWFVESLGLRGRRVLDVGCACGAIAHGIFDAGAMQCTGVDLCEHMIQLARTRWPDQRFEICDAAHLHLFADEEFDAIHSAQVAEHWKPELVPIVIRELARTLRCGGLLFLQMDTRESLARQGRAVDGPGEDPTHRCIRPWSWWAGQLQEGGFEPQGDAALRAHAIFPRFAENDWDWILARKITCAASAARTMGG